MRKDNGSIDFTVYRKPTNTGKYLDYNSYNSKTQKISVINSLLTRAIKICSKNHLENELEKCRKDLMENNYPKTEINRVINRKSFEQQS